MAHNNTEEEGVIITPRNPKTLHNFGPASLRDKVLYTSERPGGDPGENGGTISSSIVQEWIDFMKTNDIKHVLILLDDNELEIYDPPGLLDMYQSNGFVVHRNPMGVDGSSKRAMQIIESVEEKGEKVVAHCTHGMGRSGRVAAGWLARRYDLSSEDATNEVIDVARTNGMERMGNQKALEKWLAN